MRVEWWLVIISMRTGTNTKIARMVLFEKIVQDIFDDLTSNLEIVGLGRNDIGRKVLLP